MKRNFGFTLAEILIVIGIVGILAAITLPTLIQRNKRSELKSALNTGYSLLQQALQRMNADNGYPAIPENFASRTFKNEYIKYFEDTIDCKWGGDQGTTNSYLCGTGEKVYDNDGNYTQEIQNIYKTYNKGSNSITSVPLDDGQFVLKNGMLVMIENQNKGQLFITIDINGITQKPNIWGQDLFTFQLMKNGKLLPMGAQNTAYSADTYCSKTSSNKLNGIACTERALTDIHYWDGI